MQLLPHSVWPAGSHSFRCCTPGCPGSPGCCRCSTHCSRCRRCRTLSGQPGGAGAGGADPPRRTRGAIGAAVAGVGLGVDAAQRTGALQPRQASALALRLAGPLFAPSARATFLGLLALPGEFGLGPRRPSRARAEATPPPARPRTSLRRSGDEDSCRTRSSNLEPSMIMYPYLRERRANDGGGAGSCWSDEPALNMGRGTRVNLSSSKQARCSFHELGANDGKLDPKSGASRR